MKLYFRDSCERERLLAEVADENEAIKAINQFLEDHSYKSYYVRTWVENNRKWFDVGSWSEFFILDLGGNNE